MSKRSSYLILALLVMTGIGLWKWQNVFPQRSDSITVPHLDRSIPATGTGTSLAEQGATTSVSPSKDSPTSSAVLKWAPIFDRLAYAQSWRNPQPSTLAAFRDWTDRYLRATTTAERSVLKEKGLSLARQRRAKMMNLIVHDPRRALEMTVPAAVRAHLPVEVVAELESRISGSGMLSLTIDDTENGDEQHGSLERSVQIAGRTYTAYTYGRRSSQLTKENASLHGIALDGHLALHESPLRILEPGEIPAGTIEGECPVTHEGISAPAPGSPVNMEEPLVAEAHGRHWQLKAANLLPTFERLLLEAEGSPGPRVEPFSSLSGATTLETADLPATSWTTGTQRTLVIRIDFSDLPGEPISNVAAQEIMDNEVNPYYVDASYGKTNLSTTVSSILYRMPETASHYATGGLHFELHNDARAAATADWPNLETDFDRVIVAFASLRDLPGSKFQFGGRAQLGGRMVWIHSNFSFYTVAHELGHTYGLFHANLWLVTDGNPVSSSGSDYEYGDSSDLMGAGLSELNHFNPWFKNRLGWLPDSAVVTAESSGVYRIYRFDHMAANLDQPLALRVFRDGNEVYWLGYRQNLIPDSSINNGVYALWGHNYNTASQLLDMSTPGSSTYDAALAIGQTFSDPDFGVSIRPLARGGTAPDEYIDVEIDLQRPARQFVVNLSARSRFEQPPRNLTDISAVAAGADHWLALKFDGTIVPWGFDTYGQATLPTGLNNIISVAAGEDVSGAVKQDGTVVIWGYEGFGQTTVPSGLSGVKSLSIGYDHVLALKADGTVVAWGEDNGAGETAVPADLSNVIAIATGRDSSLALKSDGTVIGWGNASAPPPELNSGLKALAAGYYHSLFLRNDGTVFVLGATMSGQGDIPEGLNGVAAIAAGGWHNVALKEDGAVVQWGSLEYPEFSILGLPRAVSVTAGRYHDLAIIAAGPSAVITSSPLSQTVGAGDGVTFTVVADGTGALGYQWKKNGVYLIDDGRISGTASATLAIDNAQGGDAGNYTVLVTNSAGSVMSDVATLTVATQQPVITTQPTNQTVTTGHDATFVAAATGDPAPSHQWQVSTDNGATWTNLADDLVHSGSTTTQLTVNATVAMNGYRYRDVASNSVGTTTSNTLTLTVVAEQFPHPTGIAIDGAGNLYVADASSNTVQKVSTANVVTAFAGLTGSAGSLDGIGTNARFNTPSNMTVDSNGNIYVADRANHIIRKITPARVVTTLAGVAGSQGDTNGTGLDARFNTPTGVAVDGSGNVYVADTFNHAIRKINPAGVVTTLAGTAGTHGGADGTGSSARFRNPSGVAVDIADHVYVADTGNNMIRKITPVGIVSTLAGTEGVAGTDDGVGVFALFNQPSSLAVDGTGYVYVADTGNATVRKITPTGQVSTLAGLPALSGMKDGTGVDGWFSQLQALTVDGVGNVYVADTGNAAIRKITAAGDVSTLAFTLDTSGGSSGTGGGTSGGDSGTGGGSTGTGSGTSGGSSGGGSVSSGGGGGGGALGSWFCGAFAFLCAVRLHRLRR